MKNENASTRLKQLMSSRGLRQVDILALAQPFCEKYDVRLGKNDLSQYVSGKVEPGQDKLSILSMALNVSEAWLMGFDVSQEKAGPAANSGGPAKLVKALSTLGIDINKLSDSDISKVAALAKLALDE